MNRREARQRSAQEREQARLAREARRAGREGRPPPTAPPPTEVPPPDLVEDPPPDLVEDPPPDLVEDPPQPATPQPQPQPQPRTAGPVANEPPAAGDPLRKLPRPSAPRPRGPAAPAPRSPPPASRSPDPPAPPDPGRRPQRMRAFDRMATARAILDRRRARAARPRASGLRRRGIVPLLSLGVGVLVAGWLLVSFFQPFAGDGKGSVELTVPAGASVGEIAALLERKGVVSNAFFFRARFTLSGGSDLKAGRFELREGMSYAAAIDALSAAPPTETLKVAIPEGRARREVKELVEDTGLEGDYLALTKRSPILDPRDYGARRARDLEGFLFPATYELGPGRGARELVSQQLRTFKREFAGVDMRFARSRNRTRYDVLVIASMVEREAQLPRERPVIASVIYNRLREGIPLGIDATVRFATNNWTEPLSDPELAVDSPYNTRERQDLPPGPIGSPGLASIKAAARPARTGFLFFVVKPGTCGEHDFSKTNAEFLADQARYESARARRGGKSPTDC